MKACLITIGLAALAVAQPLSKRQTIFTTQTYDDISISGGVAGNAAQEALDVLGGLPADLTTVSEEDIDFLDSVNGICNDAEEQAFNVAIEAAGEGEEADALERGKTKNKVLKLTATMLKLQIQAAQGEDVAAKMEEENQKLSNNIAQDEAEAGNESTFLSFDATTE